MMENEKKEQKSDLGKNLENDISHKQADLSQERLQDNPLESDLENDISHKQTDLSEERLQDNPLDHAVNQLEESSLLRDLDEDHLKGDSPENRQYLLDMLTAQKLLEKDIVKQKEIYEKREKELTALLSQNDLELLNQAKEHLKQEKNKLDQLEIEWITLKEKVQKLKGYLREPSLRPVQSAQQLLNQFKAIGVDSDQVVLERFNKEKEAQEALKALKEKMKKG